MKILIANPNTSQRMTDIMVEEAKQFCREDTQVVGLAARFGVPYIATRSEVSIAGYALLELLAAEYKNYDAVVIGAFCHSLVAAAKELLPIPVIGIAEASMRSAMFWGNRVSIIGIGTHERGANEEIVSELNMDASVASINILPLSGTELAADQMRADREVIKLGLSAIDKNYADVLVLGGAAFSGMAQRVREHLPVPVISPVPYAITLAETAVLTGWRKPNRGTFAPPGLKQLDGVSSDLASLFS